MLLMGLVLSGCGGDVALAPVTKHARGSRWSPAVHTVAQGETLYSIAFQYGQDFRTMADRNGIRSPYTIYVGQKLSLRRGSNKTNTVSTPPKTAIRPEPAKTASQVTETGKKRPKSVSRAQKSTEDTDNTGVIRWDWPTQGHVIETFSSNSSTRKGIDIAGRMGQTVKAASAGRVVYSGSGLRGYGQLIIVKHNEQYLSAYAHNRKLLVKEGDTVTTGQQIAEMGNSGTDTVKLHFEIRQEGEPVNPMQYLPKRSS